METEQEVVAFCNDCLNTIADSKADKDIFLKAGKPGICPYCGGVVIVTYLSEIERLRNNRANEPR